MRTNLLFRLRWLALAGFLLSLSAGCSDGNARAEAEKERQRADAAEQKNGEFLGRLLQANMATDKVTKERDAAQAKLQESTRLLNLAQKTATDLAKQLESAKPDPTALNDAKKAAELAKQDLADARKTIADLMKQLDLAKKNTTDPSAALTQAQKDLLAKQLADGLVKAAADLKAKQDELTRSQTDAKKAHDEIRVLQAEIKKLKMGKG